MGSPVNLVLNILHVLHNMCKKIDTSKVDKNYLFHPQCRTLPGNETTLLGDADQLKKVKSELLHCDPKFPTECVWLTALYHQIGLLPQCRKLERYMKELLNITRELKRVREAKPSNDTEKRQKEMILGRME